MMHEVHVDDHASLTSRQDRVIWDLASTPPAVVCAALGLVREDVVERVAFRSQRSDWVVQVGGADADRDILARWYGPRRLEVLLGDVELGRWLAFFLRYFRDGSAEVDHLDVEGVSETGESFDLVLKVAAASSPVTAEEARRRLGLR